MTANSTRPPGPRVAKPEIHASAPALGWYSDTILFAEMWERSQLPKRDRSLVTVSALITRGNTAQLVGHFTRALAFGLRPTEIAEIVTHLAFYAGWPNAMSAVPVMQQVFDSRGVKPEEMTQSVGHAPLPTDGDASGSAMDDFTERVVLGDLWTRTELAPRDRSLVTISSLIAQNAVDQLPAQLQRGKQAGLTEAELVEAVSHIAFYVGWPKATAAMPLVRQTFKG